MSPKNPVRSLKSFCLKTIANKLIYTLSDDEGENYEVVANYLSPSTFEVLQDLIKIILSSANLDASIRFSCLQLLLREDVRKLDTGMFPQFYYQKILKVITLRGPGLQHLNLKGVWARDFPDLLSQLVRSLKGLKTLLIPHMADDAVIEAVLTLEELAVLDISGEASYTANGIEKLKSTSLQLLDIGMFGKINVCQKLDNCTELIANLIENLPNLSSVRTYSFTGNALLKVYKKLPNYKTKLKYFHDTGTTNETMEAVLALCPNLENIHLDGAEPEVVKKLSSLRKLNTLKLTKCNINEFISFLTLSGAQIQVLKLNNNKNTSLDLSQICLFAPNIQTLECYQMKITFTNLDTYFMSLENVEFTYCDMSEDVIRFILTNSPFLKRIVIGSIIRMTDGDIFRLCAECDFFNLEELWFSCARSLTATSVELLMGHCKNLKTIGQLNEWDILPEEINFLRTVISCTNTNLNLLYNDDPPT